MSVYDVFVIKCENGGLYVDILFLRLNILIREIKDKCGFCYILVFFG